MNYDHYQMPEKMADPAGITRVSEAQVHPLLAQYFEQLAPGKSMKETVVKDLGQIKQMNIPSGWNSAYEEPSRGMGARSYSSFSLADDKDVAISFFYRGSALRQTGQAQAFHSTIEGATHTLTSVEFHSIREVLQDKADSKDFALLSARTEDINGKKVLLVEGRYKTLQQDSYQIYIDADGTGAHIQEVFFQAPKDKYPAHLKEARNAIRSVEWK